MPKKALHVISTAFGKLSTVGKLKAEVDLLTSCSSDTVYRLRYDTMRYDYISPAVLNLLGYSVAELMQINLRSLILETRIVNNGMKAVESYASLEEARKRGEVKNWQADYLMRTKDGRKIWVSDISHPWFDDNGRIIGSMGSLRDITDRVNNEQKIRNEMAREDYTDKVTGLANMRTFWIRLEEEINRSRRTKEAVSLMLVNVNRLNEIKEKFGQKMEEDILSVIGRLMRRCLREIDITAHISEDNFAVIMPETPADGAYHAAKRLMRTISSHNFFANSPDGKTSCDISIGLADIESCEPRDAASLYKSADGELFAAIHKGNNSISAAGVSEHA